MQPMYIKYNKRHNTVTYNIEDTHNTDDEIVLYIKQFNREQLLDFINNIKDTMEQWTIK